MTYIESDSFYRTARGRPIIQVVATLICCLNAFTSGMHFSWTSPSIPNILNGKSDIAITLQEISWLTTVFVIGDILGSITSIYLLDRTGKKRVIMLSATLYMTSWLLIGCAKTGAPILAAKFLSGFADGLTFTSCPAYIGEIAQANVRGFLGSLPGVLFALGMLVINIVGSYLAITTVAFISLCVPLITIITFPNMPESPYYCIMKENFKGAKSSLQIFRGKKNVDCELSRIVEAVREENMNKSKYLELFTVNSNLKALLINFAVALIQQFTGVTVILFYAQTIFEQAGDSLSPATSSTIFFSMHVLFAVLATFVIDKVGRKPLAIVSLIGCGSTLLICGCYFHIQLKTSINVEAYSLIPIISFMIFIIFYSIGLHNYPLLLVGELFPTNVKAFAVSCSSVFFAATIGLASEFFYITQKAYGMQTPFLVFTVFSMFGVILLIFLVPETNCKTLERIQQELKGIYAVEKNETLHLQETERP